MLTALERLLDGPQLRLEPLFALDVQVSNVTFPYFYRKTFEKRSYYDQNSFPKMTLLRKELKHESQKTVLINSNIECHRLASRPGSSHHQDKVRESRQVARRQGRGLPSPQQQSRERLLGGKPSQKFHETCVKCEHERGHAISERKVC